MNCQKILFILSILINLLILSLADNRANIVKLDAMCNSDFLQVHYHGITPSTLEMERNVVLTINKYSQPVQTMVRRIRQYNDGSLFYVKGQFDNPKCKKTMSKNESDVTFNINFLDCVNDHKHNKHLTLVIQPNSNSEVLNSFEQPINCTSSDEIQIINVGKKLSVGYNIDTFTTVENTKTVSAELLFLDENNTEITTATIGQAMNLQIQLIADNLTDFQDGQVVECTVGDADNSNRTEKIYGECDSRNIYNLDFTWHNDMKELRSPWKAFQLPDVKTIIFSCIIRICMHQCRRPCDVQ